MSGTDETITQDTILALPVWRGAIETAPLKGGLSNESFTVTDTTGKCAARSGRDFPFRHVFRDREQMAARAAHAAGFAPEVLHAEPGIMGSRSIEGPTHGAQDAQANLPGLAAIVRRFRNSNA